MTGDELRQLAGDLIVAALGDVPVPVETVTAGLTVGDVPGLLAFLANYGAWFTASWVKYQCNDTPGAGPHELAVHLIRRHLAQVELARTNFIPGSLEGMTDA